MPEDLELGRRQADPAVAALDAAPLEVDEQVAVADDAPTGGIGQVAVRAPQERLDPAHQLAQPERLGQVVVGSQLEPDDLVDLVVASGQDEDRHLRAGRAQAAEDLEAVHAGKPDIEHHEVRRLAGRDVEALLAGPGDRDLVALLLEGVLDPAGDGVFVLDDQDGGCHAAMLHRCGGLSPSACPAAVECQTGAPSGAVDSTDGGLRIRDEFATVVP